MAGWTVSVDHPVVADSEVSRTLSPADLRALQRGAVDGSLELLYQPEIDLASGMIAGMEALLRWRCPPLGRLTPPEFLDLALQGEALVPIGSWVLRTAAAEAASWLKLDGPQRRLWINVSTTDLVAPEFPDQVAAVLGEHRLSFGAVGLEVAEFSVAVLGERAVPVLTALREAGAALAIDDSSSWIATLGAIAELPVDAVKLGHRFVRGLAADDHAASVLTVIKAAHAEGIKVVAEGVESQQECARLTELGCDRAHGFLFASPMLVAQARGLLRDSVRWPVLGRGATL